jgi:hypothetical protein
LSLGGLAAGLSLGTKPVGVVFVPFLILFGLWAIRVRLRSIKRTLAAGSLVLACVLATSGFWFGRNLVLTGNPIYPLHVEVFGKMILRGWYDRQAMRFSPYYLPLGDWRALVDTLVAVVDPRLAPFWIAALAGAWAFGRRVRSGDDRWVWALSLMAVLNIALFWTCIPYRTQQRFMLQALGLTAVPLGRWLDRARALPAAASFLLAVHLLTPQTWPFALKEADIPWDLTRVIPNDVGPPLPLLARLARVLRPEADSSAPSSLALLLGMGGCAGLAIWGWGRRRPRPEDRRGMSDRAQGFVGLAGLLVLGVLDTGAPGADARVLFYPPFRDFHRGWLNLEGRSGPAGARVAYAGTNIPYYLFGVGLRNEVRYINIDEHRDWLLHDYHRAAAARGQPTWPNSRPGWDRAHPDFRAWLENLEAEGIQLLVVTHVNPAEGPHNVADAEGFPIERVWADSHPDLFEPLYGAKDHDALFRLYRVRARGMRAASLHRPGDER